jgi:hypothetical protein
MDENLVGYLLKALDPDAHSAVESRLGTEPELRTRLEALERALAPLACDAEAPEPPPGLALGALGRIAEYRCRSLPAAPPVPRHRAGGASRGWFRRPDALVAAGLLLVVGALLLTGAARMWRDSQGRLACANNLRTFWTALETYGDGHEGNFPRVPERGPVSVAGVFVPMLHEAGVLDPNQVSVCCPAGDRRPPLCKSVRELEEMSRSHPEEFRRISRELAGNYAYSLGYCEGDAHCGLRRNSGDQMAILADALQANRESASPNHGGAGQNVLFLGGTVRWCTTRTVGVAGDDIYVNRASEVRAGLDHDDTVLGPSDSSP